jgi:hypothetical protein
MTRRFAVLVPVYGVLMLFCGVGARHLPVPAQQAIKPWFWMFGPTANLVHGTLYLVPFLLGTATVIGLLNGLVRARSVAVKVAFGVLLLLAWAGFGFISYAPAA